MATEKRLIDANKISYHKSGFPKGDGFDSGLDWAFREDIDKLHTVDAVEVVRCKKCIYRDGKTPGQPNILCYQMKDDDFCSYGERRTDEG